MRMLVVGSSDRYRCNDPKIIFNGKDVQYDYLDVEPTRLATVIHDFTKPLPDELLGIYDYVFMSHVLEHFKRADLAQVMANCWFALNKNGELWVYVPRLEWACSEILAGRENMEVQGMLYGGQADDYDLHRCGFTMKALATLVASRGFKITESKVGYYRSGWGDHVYDIPQNVVVGRKHADPNHPFT